MPRKRRVTDSKPLDKARVLEALAKAARRRQSATSRARCDVKGNDRIALKRILKELAEEGALERGKKRILRASPARCPKSPCSKSPAQDADGELLGAAATLGRRRPPKIIVVPGNGAGKRGGTRQGRTMLARLTETATAMKRASSSVWAPACTACWASISEARVTGASSPSTARRRYEFIVDNRDRGGAVPNELVLAEPLSGRASGLPRARVIERLGSMNEPKTVSLIAIHAHGIPTEFPRKCIDEAERAKPVDARGRTDLRKIPLVTIDPEDARDHDDAVWAGPDDDPANRRAYRHRRHRRCRALCDARFGARPRGAEARQLGLFPRPRRADAAGAAVGRSVFADGE